MTMHPSSATYEIRFVIGGRPVSFLVTDPEMCDARVWLHIARHLNLKTYHDNGYQLAYHSLEHLVEEQNVSNVSYELCESV